MQKNSIQDGRIQSLRVELVDCTPYAAARALGEKSKNNYVESKPQSEVVIRRSYLNRE
jgi:hypothetical protein